VFGCTAALTAALATAAGAAAAAASPASSALASKTPRAPSASLSPVPGPRQIGGNSEQLLDVSASSASNAWAVGQQLTSNRQVMLHWNGTAWSHAAIPDPAANYVDDISAVSADNAWLVGWHCPSGCPTGAATTLIMHWNGTAWSRVASPSVAGMASSLRAVSLSATGNAWAAGNACSTTVQSCVPLMLHWNGTTWSEVASPALGEVDTLTAVQTISATDAWAVGYACISGCHVPLVMHWNGRGWSAATLPVINIGGLFGVTGTSASDVWAVGDSYSPSGRFSTMIYHWNGAAWSKVAHPDPGAGGALFAVTALSRADAWAVGSSCGPHHCATSRTLILHWNGSTWSKVASPSPGTGSDLADVAATSPSNAWAVGENCRTTVSPCSRLILHWNGTAWAKA
jgi:hypothetical protein